MKLCCPEIFASNLSKIYNWGIENGTYPEELKIVKVIALYKKGVKYDPNNYRPNSLLSLFDKILEKIFCRRLVSFLEHNKIAYCYQYGFRSSTCNHVDIFTSIHDMYKTKYEVSLRPNTDCFKSSPRSPAPQLSAQIFNCPTVRWCSGHSLGILGGPTGALLRMGDSGRAL